MWSEQLRTKCSPDSGTRQGQARLNKGLQSHTQALLGLAIPRVVSEYNIELWNFIQGDHARILTNQRAHPQHAESTSKKEI